MECFAKRIAFECRLETRCFHDTEGFVELGHFNNYLIKIQVKNYTTTKLQFELKMQPKYRHNQGLFSNQNIFSIFKKGQQDLSPSHLVAHLWVWINIHQDILISLNILENACLKEYAWSFHMFDRLLEIAWVINMSAFWIWHGCIRKRYKEFCLWLNKAQYALIMLKYASKYLNAPEYVWTWLNIAECLGICLKILEKTVLTVPGLSICLIILDIWQDFEYVSGIKYVKVLNMLQ